MVPGAILHFSFNLFTSLADMLKTTDSELAAILIAISLLLTLPATWLGWRLIRKSPPPLHGVREIPM